MSLMSDCVISSQNSMLKLWSSFSVMDSNNRYYKLGRPYNVIPGYPEMTDLDLSDEDMVCNSTCCHFSSGDDFCSIDNNFTSFYNITPVSTLELTIRYLYAVPVTILGVLGNVIIISILLYNPLLLRASVNNFILNMSVADLILATSGPIPFTIRDTNDFWVMSPAWCHLEGYIQEMVLLVSVSSLTVISVDRMWGVNRPFHRHINIFMARAIIVGIWVFSAVIAIPFAIYRKYTVREWADIEETLCKETEQMGIWWPISNALLIWTPLVIICSCYGFIILRFRKYDKKIRGKEHPGLRDMKKRVVKMMFVVVLVFVVCWSPLQLFSLCKKYFIQSDGSLDPDKEQTYNLMLSIANYTIFLNPVADPTVYALMHENFRRAFRMTYPCCFKEKSTMVLMRGTGNRGFMWSTRTRETTLAEMSRVSSQSQRSQYSSKNIQPSMNVVASDGSAGKKSTKKVWTTWTHYGSREYPHPVPKFPYRIPQIPSTITEASKESSMSYGGLDAQSKDHPPLPKWFIKATDIHIGSDASKSDDNDEKVSSGEEKLPNGHLKQNGRV